jgi:altronate hydrolase
MMDYLKIHPRDNVAVALRDGLAVPSGHKIALCAIARGAPVIKYGNPIGYAAAEIAPGAHVHTHNVKTGLDGAVHYAYQPVDTAPVGVETDYFDGFLRSDGQAGIRNEIWIVPLVSCVNKTCEQLARMAWEKWREMAQGRIDGVFAFPHPYGCSQMGEDQRDTQRALAGLVRHPNAAGVLVVGLGCENNRLDVFRPFLGPVDPARVCFLNCQDETDEFEAGMALLDDLMHAAMAQKRTRLPVSMLRVGFKCGGSDGLSGVTANPLVGAFCDRLIALGGTGVLTEVPEMFGAEHLLMRRCADKTLFDQTVAMIEGFKRYFQEHGQVVYENPSPGNKDGGITTLEEKSLGCTQKSGSGPVTQVLRYGERAQKPGVTLLWGPGNDLVASTALAVAGCQLILFTTGRGTPLGAPVPTVKISTNTPLARRKPGWIDFDAGPIVNGQPLLEAAQALYQTVMQTANGCLTQNERSGFREIGIFKNGVTL